MAKRKPHAAGRSQPVVARAAAVVAVAAVILASCGGQSSPEPELALDASVATDFAELATTTFDDFVAHAPGIARCIGTVRLAAASELDELAYYSADLETITVRVPATAPSLRDSLVHELAHHVEASCPSHLALRPEFLEAQGHGPDQPWFTAQAWADTPSEEFAEAVVASVLGERRRHLSRIRIEPPALAIVAEWLKQDAAASAGGA